MAIRRRKIESLIEELLASYNVTEAPVPVERIAKAKGARIFYQSLEGDVSGFLYRDAAQAVIGVNTHHAPVRQHFTTAHELGLSLIHIYPLKDGPRTSCQHSIALPRVVANRASAIASSAS